MGKSDNVTVLEKEIPSVRVQEVEAPVEHASVKHEYLTGLRGILTVQSFLWTFFITFVPAVVAGADIQDGPGYQKWFRWLFAVLFWNESFIYNFTVLLSMRTIGMTFLTEPTGQRCAASVIRRIFRMVVMIGIAAGISTLLFSQLGVSHIDAFRSELPNDIIDTPATPYSGLAAVNSLFELFWVPSGFYSQAAVSFWPTRTLWVPSIIYYQSWTVYLLMAFLPWTKPEWHIQGLGLFALGSFWMQGWGWYSATGLFFADIATNKALHEHFKQGLAIKDKHFPYYIVAAVLGAAGLAMKYVWAVLPQFINSELYLHPFLVLAERQNINTTIDNGPYARVDDWLIVVAIFIMVEYFDVLKKAFSWRPLVILGERAFSTWAMQCILFWSAGIKLWLHFVDTGYASHAGANALVLLIVLCLTIILSEAFYRAVDLPSAWLARQAYVFLTS